MMYFLLEVIKLSVIVACKKLPLDAKTYFIVAECTKLLVVGLVMLGLHLYNVDTNKPVQIEDKLTRSVMTTEYNDKRWVVSYENRQGFRQEARYAHFENALVLAKRQGVGVWDDVEKVTIW